MTEKRSGSENNMENITGEDLKAVAGGLGELAGRFENGKVLITGHTGFLGTHFTAFFDHINRHVLKKPARVTCIDNHIVPLEDLAAPFARNFTVIHGDASQAVGEFDFDYIFHCAGIASPPFYRKFPLETIRANAISLWEMLGRIEPGRVRGFLYFSSSEIYGDPTAGEVPTSENYRGNVSCTGPRSCYDESKRFGEAVSIAFAKEKNIPVKIARPFNVYGPFMRLHDGRVIPDFVKSALKEGKIRMFSDGGPTRSFCYSRDAVEGFLRVLLLGEAGRPYNIGNDAGEISVSGLADLVAGLTGNVKVEKAVSEDSNYLADNPQRRCPSLERAKKELGYGPKVSLEDGLRRTIAWYKGIYSD